MKTSRAKLAYVFACSFVLTALAAQNALAESAPAGGKVTGIEFVGRMVSNLDQLSRLL